MKLNILELSASYHICRTLTFSYYAIFMIYIFLFMFVVAACAQSFKVFLPCASHFQFFFFFNLSCSTWIIAPRVIFLRCMLTNPMMALSCHDRLFRCLHSSFAASTLPPSKKLIECLPLIYQVLCALPHCDSCCVTGQYWLYSWSFFSSVALWRAIF